MFIGKYLFSPRVMKNFSREYNIPKSTFVDRRLEKAFHQFIDSVQCKSYWSKLNTHLIKSIEYLPIGGLLGSGSSQISKPGKIQLSITEKQIDFNCNVIHESTHQLLLYYQSKDRIVWNVSMQSYSPIRMTQRPSILSLHAIAVYCHILMYLNDYNIQHSYYKKHIMDLIKSIQLLDQRNLTPMGRRIFKECLASLIYVL